MKIIKLEIAGGLYQDETGRPAQVGDQVKLFLDTEARPGFPEFVFGIIQPGIKLIHCDEYTQYSIEYDDGAIPSGFLLPDDVTHVTATDAVDVVAQDLAEVEERLDADIAAETAARITADTAEQTARINADNALDARLDILEIDGVRYTSQTNSSARQLQARTNIGVINIDFANSIIRDGVGNTSINWQDRTLSNSVVGVVLYWSGSHLTLVNGVGIQTSTANGSSFGTTVNEKVSFHGVTPTVQRAGAAQAAVVTTAATQTTPWGFTTQAQANAIITLLNEIRTTLVEKGMMKGSA